MNIASLATLIIGLLIAVLAFGAGFFSAKQLYRKKYKQEHNNVLNCVTYAPKSEQRLYVFAVATHYTPELQRLVRSFTDIGGVSIEIIGLGCKWQGFGNKPLWLREKIRQMNLGESDLVLFVDAYDVICIQNLALIKERFGRFGKRLVFGAERGCHPDSTLAALFPWSNTSMRYTNSGGFIGYADEIVKMIDWADPKPHEDDQLLACKYTLAAPDRVGLDYEAAIFLNLFDVHSSEIEFGSDSGSPGSRVIRFKETGCLPLIIHGNGPSKAMLNSLASEN
jgi:hypothetical protein